MEARPRRWLWVIAAATALVLWIGGLAYLALTLGRYPAP
jgi:hypothetical protein